MITLSINRKKHTVNVDPTTPQLWVVRDVSTDPPRNSARGAVESERRRPMNTIFNLSRRSFFKTSALAGGGLVLGVYFPELDRSAEAAEQAASTFVPNAFLRIGKDGS